MSFPRVKSFCSTVTHEKMHEYGCNLKDLIPKSMTRGLKWENISRSRGGQLLKNLKAGPLYLPPKSVNYQDNVFGRERSMRRLKGTSLTSTSGWIESSKMYRQSSGKRKIRMYQHRRPNFDRAEDTSKPWAKTGAWFLGPKADNAEEFKDFVNRAIETHIKFRDSYFPFDPPYVTQEMRQAASFQETMKKIDDELENMQKQLVKAVPFFSSRYKGHVTWDTVMPSNLGYITALLFNANNCAAEASTVTTPYEVEVGLDLCKMVGFDPDKAMGHLVTGGTVANIESMWVARNVKYYALGLQEAILKDDSLYRARELTVYLPSKKQDVKIVDATSWELLNLKTDVIIELPERVASMCAISKSDLSGIMSKYAYESIGTQMFSERHNLKTNPCFLAPTTAHVSIFKGATITGVGKANLVLVPVDENARMDVKGLRDILEDKLANQIPVISVVAVMGTTEESAVDPLVDILEIREEMRSRGLDFMIHADGAWGGYFCTMLRTPPTPLDQTSEDTSWYVPELNLNSHTHAQLSAIPQVDTITIDPHKSGFCPYPAGATGYRDRRINSFLGITNQVTYYHGSLNLGDVGIEGSKPGAAAAGVVMAHRVIGLHKNGYGRILGECTFTAKLLYCYWTALAKPEDPFFIVPTKPLPPDRTREEHIKFMKRHIIGKTNEELAENEEVMKYLREVGPDTMVPCFTLNVKGNTDVNKLNDIVQAVFKDLCMSDDRVASFRFPMIVTASTYGHHPHSIALKELKKRLGVDPYDTTGVKYIITTCMDPWATSMEFLEELASIMRNTILCSIGTVTDLNVHHDFVTTGHIDGRNNMIVYYAGKFLNISHQYHALAKVQFINPADGELAIQGAARRGTEPLMLRSVEQKCLHDLLLYDFEEGEEGRREPEIEVYCYSGIPTADKKPFMKTTIRVVDVSRLDHFDASVQRYPDKSKYILYGGEDKAYISHIPVKKPDFLQLVELDGIPEGVSKLLLNYGIEIEMPFDGNPKERRSGGEIEDPLTESSYVVSFTGEDAEELKTTVTIDRKIFFDSDFINSN